MKIEELQARLRALIRSRIHRGELTGLALAREAGFQQAHLSNFLNSRRGLSLESMDRLLAALRLGTLDLMDPEELRRRSNQLSHDESMQRAVGLVSAENATSPRVAAEHILDSFSFKKTFLQGLRPNTVGDRSDWERFVLIKADVPSAKAMAPGSARERFC